ncbi:nicotinate-nucleotide adenylyltransferase [Sporosarcina sp. HYO08]|uniref:nicotinate-nucleotide adenylyltransferase n=1 Tax=Sporosarcina sp. HYO08 TaxID=1759557 RepID=UPI000793E40F|nr:nicotinate-nucleotide adenylyltransferase [Sporosarcina sp. HYO08]KXH87380.1 nicotinate-nicotinamide nucleotide adenylyltransferase [Sporosarcina sp. HYO08]
MRKIGILGGTFNPPHIGHLIIANEVRHALNLAEVRLMPTATPPHKKAASDATEAQRLDMVGLAVRDIDGLTKCALEIERGGVSYTYDTMKRLTELEPDVDFHFIIGADMIDMLKDWHRIDELIELVTFVGVGRPGAIGKTEFPITIVDIPEIDLSSTFIRRRIANGETVQLLIPGTVESYIRKEGLYGSRSHKAGN